MQTRRDFLKLAMILSGAAGFSGVIPDSIQRAYAIDPEPESSFLDAKHIVILMQENRSFDHALGSLQGVRGFNDPRAIRLPNGNRVWLQTNAKGETYVPFRLNIHDTRATWMGFLPHGRKNQVEAWKNGEYDSWLDVKRSHVKEYSELPLTLGHYTREDIPFYYALADAFTVCDQHFSGVMTSTHPNRLLFWTGTLRDRQEPDAKPHLRNEDSSLGGFKWETFPECLQKNGISWKFYQNDVDAFGGLSKEEEEWLGNFGCNPLEYFVQYNVKLSPQYLSHLQEKIDALVAETGKLEEQLVGSHLSSAQRKKLQSKIKKNQKRVNVLRHDQQSGEGALDKLSRDEKELYQRALTTNAADLSYRELVGLTYEDGTTRREVSIPKGDVLYQFRNDVQNGRLPTVSWLMGPRNFSDHPISPWYGAWYVSEIMDILTKNPDVWKRTIFVLTYDENDGYFDHIPPFVAPDPKRRETGLTSPGLDPGVEYAYREQEIKQGVPKWDACDGPTGLGFRVPMIIASPWSRGGWVNSQLFDHTSTIQFLEEFLSEKLGRTIRSNNISRWRRAISGDLTTSFRKFHGEKIALPFLERDPFVVSIERSQCKDVPSDFKRLSESEIVSVNSEPLTSQLMSHQEKGIRPSCALPYQLYAEGVLSSDRRSFETRFRAEDGVFDGRAKGSPFNVYLRGLNAPAMKTSSAGANNGAVQNASYTVAAGAALSESWPLEMFVNREYHVCIYGPNGFFRDYAGDADDPELAITCEYEASGGERKHLTGNVEIGMVHTGANRPYILEIVDNSYGAQPIKKVVHPAGGREAIVLDLKKSFGWYDFSVRVKGLSRFEKRYAGRVETGQSSFSDPLMGAMLV